MEIDLYNDDTWRFIQDEIIKLYNERINRFDFNNKMISFIELKIIGNVYLRVLSNGSFEVSCGIQLRMGHLSDIVGTNINHANAFSLPTVVVPKRSKGTPPFSSKLDKSFSEWEASHSVSEWQKLERPATNYADSDELLRDLTIIKNKRPEWDLDPASPFNNPGEMIKSSDLMNLPIEQLEYYHARMRYESKTKMMTSVEFDNLYMNQWPIGKDEIWDASTEPRRRPAFPEHSNSKPNPDDDITINYTDEVYHTEQEGAENMAETVDNNDKNENNNSSGWHAPVVRYDPEYQKAVNVVPALPRFPKYAQDTLMSIYVELGRKVWNPQAPELVGPNGSKNKEISGETNIHQSWLDVAKVSIQNKDYMISSFIPTLRRKLEYEKIVMARQSMAERKYPSNEVFNQFIVKRYKAALKRDNDRTIKRKNVLKDMKKFLADEHFIHMHVHEDMVAAATLANNAMLTLAESERPKLDEYLVTVKEYFNHLLNNKGDDKGANVILQKTPPAFTVKGYLDFDACTYPKYMGEEMTEYYAKIKHNPTDLIYQIMKHNVDRVGNILKQMPGNSRLESSIYIANPIEWALDFVRYAIERVEYYNASKDLDQVFMRDLENDPIFLPLPLRMAINLVVKEPKDLEFGALPAQILDMYTVSNKSRITTELWEGRAFMTIVRDLPWRNEIAPQLWDTTYYCSTMVPKVSRRGTYIGPDKVDAEDPYDAAHTKYVYENFDQMSCRIMAGRDAVTDDAFPLTARKNAGETHDELGWYLSFYRPSKMENL